MWESGGEEMFGWRYGSVKLFGPVFRICSPVANAAQMAFLASGRALTEHFTSSILRKVNYSDGELYHGAHAG
jgi:hypothetical protein